MFPGTGIPTILCKNSPTRQMPTIIANWRRIRMVENVENKKVYVLQKISLCL